MVAAGRIALWVALATAAGAGLAPLLGRAGRARALLAVSAAAAVLATAALGRALVVGDWSLVYVADFSRRGATAPYRLAALWGGMAGSLLALATVVALAGLLSAIRLRARPGDGPRPGDLVAAVTGAVVAALLALVVGFADPFRTLAVPAIDGGGLTPILEHRAMLYHPPLLYLGLATLVGPFALTVAALAGRRLDDGWLDTARRWSLVPWTLLGVGMVAGAHWAYVELGWGGYWAWDPVENTALLPWLALTLFLHAARGSRTDRPPVARPAVAALACLPFLLALLGSLITRSGATSSVHAFAESRAIGRALVAVVVAATVGVAILVRRAGRGRRHDDLVEDGRRPPVTVARLTAAHLVVGGALLAVVLTGTLWPLAVDLRGGDGIAVEGTYFARFAGPLVTAALALACLVPVAVAARRPPPGAAVATAAALGACAGAGLVAAAAPVVTAPPVVLAAAAGACAASAAVGAARAARRGAPLGGHLAHAAIGLLVLGIAGTTTGGTLLVPLEPGEEAHVLGHVVAYDGVEITDGPVTGSSAVVADVTADGHRLRPSLVAYPERAIVLAETSLRSTPAVDVQVILRTATDDGAAVLEIGVHPLQVVVWWGGLAVVLAGAWALVEASRTVGRRAGSAAPDAAHPPKDLPAGIRGGSPGH